MEVPIHERQLVYRVPAMDNVAVQQDLTYTNIGETEQKLDIYQPPDVSPGERRPGVVFIHGSPIPPDAPPATRWGQSRSWGQLAAASGLVGVTLCHRYHDFTCLEQANSDIWAALDFVRSRADQFNLDADRLCLWVCSGGGPFLGPVLREKPGFVRCIVSYYALLDLRSIGLDSRFVKDDVIEKFSPVAQLGPTEIPMYIVRAGLDMPPLNQSIEHFIQKALADNVPFDFANHAGGHHAFDVLDDNARSREIITATMDFIKAHT